jgi:hypothetical protein
VVLVLLMGAGALIRHSFVARHNSLVQGKRVPWEYAMAGTGAIAGLAVWLMPARTTASAAAAPVTFAQAQAVIRQR